MNPREKAQLVVLSALRANEGKMHLGQLEKVRLNLGLNKRSFFDILESLAAQGQITLWKETFSPPGRNMTRITQITLTTNTLNEWPERSSSR